jgi:hypothetical protein
MQKAIKVLQAASSVTISAKMNHKKRDKNVHTNMTKELT